MTYRVEIIDNTARLRSDAPAWDDLWERSDFTCPTSRAALIAQWVDEFAPSALFNAIVVRDGSGQFVAGLPLVARDWFTVFRVGDLPSGEWSTSGALLVDPTADVPRAMDLMVEAIKRLPWEMLWLEYAHYGLPAWQALLAALDRAKIGVDLHEKFQIGQIDIGQDWAAYEATFTKNHRKNLGRLARKTERETKAEFKWLTDIPLDQLDALIERGFQVEDRSWKGSAGSSVIRSPGMLAFFQEQARLLAKTNNLALAFLDFEGEAVAFAYGYRAKGVFHFFKWGYDENWQVFGPGQQLAGHILRTMHEEKSWNQLDLAGPLTETTAKWQPQSSFAVGRMVIAPTAILGRALFYAYQNLAPLMRRLRGGTSAVPAEVVEKEEPVTV